MLRIFVDTSVLFSALYSSRGHAKDLLIYTTEDQVRLVVTNYVLEELDEILRRKIPGRHEQLANILEAVAFEIAIEPTDKELNRVHSYVNDPKDVPIVAGVIKASVDYLVTYDRKDLLDPPEVREQSKLKIVTPIEIISIIEDA